MAELKVMLMQEPTVSRTSDSLLRAQRGSIINIASTCGSMVIEDMMPYIVSKHAVLGITKAAAVDHAAQKVRINAVSPGLVETPMIVARRKQLQDRTQAVEKKGSARFLPADMYDTPLGRLALAEEVADACIFLASTMSSHTTASFVNVDGGRLAVY
jgi:NAD(P)-dependent dehydrogenase (short-subunit alcohol dehydrogenase family)